MKLLLLHSFSLKSQLFFLLFQGYAQFTAFIFRSSFHPHKSNLNFHFHLLYTDYLNKIHLIFFFMYEVWDFYHLFHEICYVLKSLRVEFGWNSINYFIILAVLNTFICFPCKSIDKTVHQCWIFASNYSCWVRKCIKF